MRNMFCTYVYDMNISLYIPVQNNSYVRGLHIIHEGKRRRKFVISRDFVLGTNVNVPHKYKRTVPMFVEKKFIASVKEHYNLLNALKAEVRYLVRYTHKSLFDLVNVDDLRYLGLNI